MSSGIEITAEHADAHFAPVGGDQGTAVVDHMSLAGLRGVVDGDGGSAGAGREASQKPRGDNRQDALGGVGVHFREVLGFGGAISCGSAA